MPRLELMLMLMVCNDKHHGRIFLAIYCIRRRDDHDKTTRQNLKKCPIDGDMHGAQEHLGQNDEHAMPMSPAVLNSRAENVVTPCFWTLQHWEQRTNRALRIYIVYTTQYIIRNMYIHITSHRIPRFHVLGPNTRHSGPRDQRKHVERSRPPGTSYFRSLCSGFQVRV